DLADETALGQHQEVGAGQVALTQPTQPRPPAGDADDRHAHRGQFLEDLVGAAGHGVVAAYQSAVEVGGDELGPQPNHRRSTIATPSSSTLGAISSAAALTRSSAWPMATACPAHPNIGRSLAASPN